MGVARTASCHLQTVSTPADLLSYGNGKNRFLPFQSGEHHKHNNNHMVMVMVWVMVVVVVMVIVMAMVMVMDWQEPVLAIV